jgi:hypothetical protein
MANVLKRDKQERAIAALVEGASIRSTTLMGCRAARQWDAAVRASVALHFAHYNFVRRHRTLTKANGGLHTTPAMAAGVTDGRWTISDLMDAALSN